jgi:Na+/H+ antiporter NhaD/arsenite permease-like protein
MTIKTIRHKDYKCHAGLDPASIIIQHAEKENNGESITFLEFAKVGIPLTIINILVYLLFFWII